MRYLLMICEDEKALEGRSNEENGAVLARYGALMGDLTERGILLGGERLQFSTDATTVRVRDGEVLTTDGPFAETKEQIGGYFLVDCKDLDQALEVAAKIPGAEIGSIEVRPIWEM